MQDNNQIENVKDDTLVFRGWPSLTLCKFYKVPVRIDITFALVPVWLLVSFSSPSTFAEWLKLGVLTVGIFLSVLLHEFGHTVAAKSHRVTVKEIVVGGFFGYASLRSKTIKRRLLMHILAAGPVVNLILSLGMWAALSMPSISELMSRSSALFHVHSETWLIESLSALTLINFMMFLFNILPVYPLDGGRIVGLFLDGKTGLRTSLKIVSGLSVLVGVAMVVFGGYFSVVIIGFGVYSIMINLQRYRKVRLQRFSA